MAVAHKFAAEFPGWFFEVLRAVAECAECNPNRTIPLVRVVGQGAQLTASGHG